MLPLSLPLSLKALMGAVTDNGDDDNGEDNEECLTEEKAKTERLSMNPIQAMRLRMLPLLLLLLSRSSIVEKKAL